tara:strand:- start:15 stop:272 length:258 start_codon:yes stop_codon:yes gene_type:complete
MSNIEETEKTNEECEIEVAYNKEWIPHYIYLESLRQSGVTNMFGASPYLEQARGLSKSEAISVLSSWMENYDALIEDGVISQGSD